MIAGDAGRALVLSIKDMLTGARTARLAVGFLFVQGLIAYTEDIAPIEQTRILIGNVVNRLTEEQIREQQALLPGAVDASFEDPAFAAGLRDARNRAALETSLNLRRIIEDVPHTDANGAELVHLARLIAEGKLLVRLYTDGMLHSKVSVVEYGPEEMPTRGAAIVGSSNITLPPRSSVDNCHFDLDVFLSADSDVAAVTAWFDAHWARSQDFQKELFDELGRCWAISEETRRPQNVI